MSLNPSTQDGDGPVEVTFLDGEIERWDRVWHTTSGMVQLFNVDRDRDRNRRRKGDRAKSVPVDRIEEMVYTNYGDS